MKQFLTFLLLVWATLTMLASHTDNIEENVDTLLKVRHNRGLAATRTGLYNDALRYWLEYLELADSHPGKATPDDLFTAYLAVGSIHFAFEDYESAVQFFRKGNELARKQNQKATQIRFLSNLVGGYAELGDPVRSDSCNEAMHRLAMDEGLNFEHNYLFNKGYCARKKGDYPTALK